MVLPNPSGLNRSFSLLNWFALTANFVLRLTEFPSDTDAPRLLTVYWQFA
jgi:hypothetical protein